MENQSEVAQLMRQIGEEYESAKRGLSGVSLGSSRHAFITAKMEHIGELGLRIDELVEGNVGIACIIQALDDLTDVAQAQQ